MRKILIVLIITHSLAFVCNAEQEIRGLWAATVFCLDFPSQPGLTAEQLKSEIDDLVLKTKQSGFNALFFQVRPCADSFFPSEIFPWSAWLTGKQGQAPAEDFDPLAYLTETAHASGIQLHAWVNPFRITRSKQDSKAEALSTLSADHPARQHPEWVVFHTDGCLYFDPGLPQVRRLVRDGVLEIARNYPVDGIHFDDYFYPGTDFADDESFHTYGAEYRDRSTFRTAAVNSLIAGVYSDLKNTGKDIRFGVSPPGIWANSDTDPRGSDTIGYEGLTQSYADALAWMDSGTVDYIAPQIYWAVGAREGEFQTLLNWWREQAARTGTDLLIGLAGYKTAEATDPSDVWYDGTELTRQLQLLTGVTNGYILFRAGSLFSSSAVAACFGALPQEIPPIPEYWPLQQRWLTTEDALQVNCRTSSPCVLALRGRQAISLKADRSGNASGLLHDPEPGSAPVIYASFAGPCLLIHISPGVVSVVESAQCLYFRESSTDQGLLLSFRFSRPVEASIAMSDGRIFLDIPAQRLPLLFETSLLTDLDCRSLPPGSRYVLTPASPPRTCDLFISGNTVTLRLQ